MLMRLRHPPLPPHRTCLAMEIVSSTSASVILATAIRESVSGAVASSPRCEEHGVGSESTDGLRPAHMSVSHVGIKISIERALN